MPRVKFENPSKVSIMVLILASILEKNLAKPSALAKVANTESVINIQAGKMKVHLIISKGECEIKMGWHAAPTATAAGSMEAIMNVGKWHFHKIPLAMLAGDFKIGGNIFALLPLIFIMKM